MPSLPVAPHHSPRLHLPPLTLCFLCFPFAVFILDFFAQSPCKEEWRVLLTVSAAGTLLLLCTAAMIGGLPARCAVHSRYPRCLLAHTLPQLHRSSALWYHLTLLQYLAEVKGLEKREGAQKLPFEKPLVDVSVHGCLGGCGCTAWMPVCKLPHAMPCIRRGCHLPAACRLLPAGVGLGAGLLRRPPGCAGAPRWVGCHAAGSAPACAPARGQPALHGWTGCCCPAATVAWAPPPACPPAPRAAAV